MATAPRTHYWIYELRLTDEQVNELEDMVRNDKAEYVAGKMIGMLRSNGKIIIIKDKHTDVIGEGLAHE